MSIKPTKLSLFFCMGFVFNLSFSQDSYAEIPNPSIDKFSILNDKVTLLASNISLKDVLQTLCEKANIQLTLNGQFQKKVNITTYNQPINHFFKKLLGNSDFVLIYSEDKQTIKSVLLYESSKTSTALTSFIDEPLPKEVLEQLDWIHYLSTRPEDEAIVGLADILSIKETHIKSKQYAIEQLSSFSHNKAIVNAIAGGLKDDRIEIREQVINTLGQLEYQTSHQILGQVIFGEKDSRLRLQAVKHLAGTNTLASKAFLKAALKDESPAVQAEAKFILESYLY